MVKRLISCNASEILSMNREELKQSIESSEGRVILAENVVNRESFVGDITNSEISRAFGADLILLNGLDVFNPVVCGIKHDENNFILELKKLVGRPIGANLEPVDLNANMIDKVCTISEGRQANINTIKKIEELKLDFVCLTGNPGTGVTNKEIIKAIDICRENFSGLIIAGKMHGAGVKGKVIDLESVKTFIKAGADVILVPSIGTVPSFSENDLREIAEYAHERDTLVMTAIGTSQEGSSKETIREMAIRNKICGADIQHIGDAGFGGVAPVENIFEMSKAIRGIRHTVSMIARSINR